MEEETITKEENGAPAATATKFCEYCQEIVAAKAKRCKHCKSSLTNTSSEDAGLFEVVREESSAKDDNGSFFVANVYVIIKDDTLKERLRGCMTDSKQLYGDQPRISAASLFQIMPLMKSELKYDNIYQTLYEFLEKEFAEQSKIFEELRKENKTTYDYLRIIFAKGTKCYGLENQHKVGMEVTDTYYMNSGFSNVFMIQGEVIKSNGERFYSDTFYLDIPSFKGVKNISDLPVRLMDDETMKELQERGKKFNDLGIGSHYLSYKGLMNYKTQHYTQQWRADGRIMIDGTCFNKMNPNYPVFNRGRSEGKANTELPENVWYSTWPTIGGFSLTIKKWGEIAVQDTFPVKFDEDCFGQLVLDPDTKHLLQSVILYNDNSFADIISGKGAGCIFLLHGNPGCGKTLTAEAIAEMLKRPLYSVSVGELGTDTLTLETNLRDILVTASSWDAVILIDEADIFLEKRANNDIERNAMVGIFLRLLEYHQGFLFLTTNRVACFDEAFHSRINISIHYKDLDKEARGKIWKNFCDIAKIDGLDYEKLGEYELNGRQIRNTVRLAQCLAKSDGKGLSMTHIERAVRIPYQFREALKKEENSTFNK